MNALVFGCSFHIASGHWQVWQYDDTDAVQPLARYHERSSAEAVAVELARHAAQPAHSAGIATVLSGGEMDPEQFTEQEMHLLRRMIADALHAKVSGTNHGLFSMHSSGYDSIVLVRVNASV